MGLLFVTRDVRLCANLLDFLGGRAPLFEIVLLFERLVDEWLVGAVELEELVCEDVMLEIDILRMEEGYSFNGVGLRVDFCCEGSCVRDMRASRFMEWRFIGTSMGEV